jgi:hypothetical protein
MTGNTAVNRFLGMHEDSFALKGATTVHETKQAEQHGSTLEDQSSRI